MNESDKSMADADAQDEESSAGENDVVLFDPPARDPQSKSVPYILIILILFAVLGAFWKSFVTQKENSNTVQVSAPE